MTTYTSFFKMLNEKQQGQQAVAGSQTQRPAIIWMFVRLTKIKLCHTIQQDWTETKVQARNLTSSQNTVKSDNKVSILQDNRLRCLRIMTSNFWICFILPLSFLFFKEAQAAVFCFKGKTYFHMCWYRKNPHTFKQNNLSIIHPPTHIHMPVSMQFHQPGVQGWKNTELPDLQLTDSLHLLR